MIKRATAEDWTLWRDVRLRALGDAPGAFLETLESASQAGESYWRRRAAADDTQASFLREDGAGMVGCFISDDPANVFLVAMWVAPDLRGKGAAGELVRCVVDWARERRAARVCLSVELGNDRAVRLYEKCGFVETTDPPPFPYEAPADNRFYVLEL